MTADEQREFTRLARPLLSGGMTEAELGRELGYDSDEELRRAVETGRATTARLERLRSLAFDRLGERLTAAAREASGGAGSQRGGAERSGAERGGAERGGSQRGGSEVGGSDRSGSGASSSAADSGEGGGRRGAGAGQQGSRAARAGGTATGRGGRRQRSARKEFLDEKGHGRLVDAVDHLRAVDSRFENWSLLAKVMGLSSGQAAKRAYEVNSSLATLQNVEKFSRLHAGFGSRATTALKAGMPIGDLQTFLTDGGTKGVESVGDAPVISAGAAAAGSAAGGARRRRRKQGAGRGAGAGDALDATVSALRQSSDLPAARGAGDTARLFEIAAAVDAELAGLWETLRFFDGVSRTAALPATLREAAAETRDHIRRAVDCFGGEVEIATADQVDAGAASAGAEGEAEDDAGEGDAANGEAETP